MLKGKIIVTIDGQAEVFKDTEADTHRAAQLEVLKAMQETQDSSPYAFDQVDPNGQCMVDTDGRLWQFNFVDDNETEAFLEKAAEKLAARKRFDELTEEEKNDIIEVDGKRYIRAIYQQRWDKEHTKQIKLKLNNRTDADILEKLDQVESKQAYIKGLIRADINK